MYKNVKCKILVFCGFRNHWSIFFEDANEEDVTMNGKRYKQMMDKCFVVLTLRNRHRVPGRSSFARFLFFFVKHVRSYIRHFSEYLI